MEYLNSAKDILSKFVQLHVDSFKEDPYMSSAVPFSLLLLLAILPGGVRCWNGTISLIVLVKGLVMLVFPEKFAALLMTSNPDALHLQEMRWLGTIEIIFGVMYFLTKKYNDAGITATFLWAYTLYFGLAIIVETQALQSYSAKKSNNFSWNSLNVSIHCNLMWFIGCVAYLLCQKDYGGYIESTNCRSTHLRLDFAAWLILGLVAYVFPKIICDMQVNVKTDSLHLFMARLLGCGFIAISFTAAKALHFLREEDKKSVLLSHAFGDILYLFLMICCYVWSDIFNRYSLISIFFSFLTLTNCLMACEPKQLLGQLTRKLKVE